MKPTIDRTMFGSIIIEDQQYDRDLIIRLDGKIEKRKKKLSKAVYGTSHTISLDEARYVYQKGAELLIVGTGQYGMVGLSDEAAGYFEKKGCDVELLPMKDAILAWNEAEGAAIGLFHITC